MRNSREEASCSTDPGNNAAKRNLPVLDFTSVVKGLQGINSQELGKLIREAENNIIACTSGNGLDIQIDVEKLARYLPLHLIAVIMDKDRDEALFQYLLSGLCLLHSLCDLAPRHPKIEQILLDDVKVSEQLIDLIFYLLTVLAACKQEYHAPNDVAHLHSTLVGSTLSLLTGCISSQLPELSQVLLAYYKVDVFMDVAFAAVRIDIKFLQTRLSAESADFCRNSSHTAEQKLNHLCQQCEASLQFLQSLCQQKLFRERLLKNKELCGKGGVLLLAQAVLKLNISQTLFHSSAVVAAVSRMKSKILSVLLHLCEAESVSYLDEVASNPGSLNLAKSVALEVLELLKKMFGRDTTQQIATSTQIYPKGQLQLNAMRLADIFSDDSNFRSYITRYFTEVLAAIFSVSHGEFLSSWCSSELPVWEEDTTLDYDPCAAAGWALQLFSVSAPSLNVGSTESTFVPGNIPRASYAHHRTSLLVKVIANLHCFVPEICKEEKGLFLLKFYECLQKELPKLSDGLSALSDAEKAVIVSRNLRSLLSHAESLIPGFLNEEDVQLLRVFIDQLESMLKPAQIEENRVQESKSEGFLSQQILSRVNISEHHQEVQSKRGCSSPQIKEVAPNLEQSNFRNNSTNQSPETRARGWNTNKNKDNGGDVRETQRDMQIVETSGSDSSSVRGKNPIERIDDVEPTKETELAEVKGDEKVETVQYEEKHQRKRKRTIMNDKQIAIIEKALVDEPDMHRNATSLLLWADKLSAHGSDVTTAQLKNWLNNRKARLARGAKDGRLLSEVDNPDKQAGLTSYDPLRCRSEGVYVPSIANGSQSSGIGDAVLKAHTNENSGTLLAASGENITHAEHIIYEPGQFVSIVDKHSKEIGTAKVYQVRGSWYGKELTESGTCVVDIMELKADRFTELPHPSEYTGNSFDETEKRLGLMRVLWDSNYLTLLSSR